MPHMIMCRFIFCLPSATRHVFPAVKLDLLLAGLTERKHTYLVCGTLGRTLVASEHIPSQLPARLWEKRPFLKKLAITMVSPFIQVRSRACAISVAANSP